LNTTETENSIIVSITSPSVKPESFTIYIDHGKLVIYSTLKSNDSSKGEVAVPMFFKIMDIPFYVDGERINAEYEDGKLNIVLPFREETGQLQRKVNIKQS
jgi:HSP20 family molecular chaperone IbpA